MLAESLLRGDRDELQLGLAPVLARLFGHGVLLGSTAVLCPHGDTPRCPQRGLPARRFTTAALLGQRRLMFLATARASLRRLTASFPYRLETWVFTVFSETNRAAAMSA